MEQCATVYILLSDSGGGHRTFAETIRSMIHEIHPNLAAEFLYTADIYKNSRVYPLNWIDSFYNNCPKFILPFAQKISQYLFRHYINLFSKLASKNLQPFWREKKPIMVISVYPLINKVVYESLQAYNPKIPFVTVIADFGEMHNEAWIVKQNQYYVCPTDNLYKTLMSLEIPKEKVIKTTGFLLPPVFHQHLDNQKALYRRELGLDEKLPTIIIVFGAYGSFDSFHIFGNLNKVKRKLQLVFITGKNRPIPVFLKKGTSHHKIVTLPFTNHLEKYFAASDLLIGKPGPNIVSQAISQNLPVIVNKNAFTMIQERYVADFVKDNEVGIVVKNFSKLDQLITDLLETDRLNILKANTAKQTNQAYHEISRFIGNILTTTSCDR